MNLKEIDFRKIYRTWKKGLGPYRCFFRSSPFVSLQTYDDFKIKDVHEEADEKILSLVLNESSDNNFVIADFEFDKILDIALKINNENKIKPILNINLLFHPFGIVGTKDNICRLIKYSDKLIDIKTNKYVMLIPYDRYDEKINMDKMNDKLNNQYSVGFDDLPTVEFLKNLGFEGISIVTRNEIKEDLMDYITYIRQYIKVNLVKVDN
ncbi:MAG TPA: normocyte-binding protein [Clostridium sp.]|nr:normocyte-binding protein [Clostridium sp.]